MSDLDVTSNDDGSISLREPVVGIGARGRCVRDQPSGRSRTRARSMNTPGNPPVPGARAPGDLRSGPGAAAQPRPRAVRDARPRRQHALPHRTCSASSSATSVAGRHRVSALLATDHHNIGWVAVAGAVPPPLVVAGRRRRPDRSRGDAVSARQPTTVATSGASVATSSALNYFWYLRYPAGNYARVLRRPRSDLGRRRVAGLRGTWSRRQGAVRVGSGCRS